MNREIKPCSEIIEYKDHFSFGGLNYRKCGRKDKYKIKYKSPVNGKMKEQLVCGIHFISAQKNAASVLKRRSHDVCFEYETILK